MPQSKCVARWSHTLRVDGIVLCTRRNAGASCLQCGALATNRFLAALRQRGESFAMRIWKCIT
eukprot:487992-Amphidinium_carterae.1